MEEMTTGEMSVLPYRTRMPMERNSATGKSRPSCKPARNAERMVICWLVVELLKYCR
jgi:hypothetical protein